MSRNIYVDFEEPSEEGEQLERLGLFLECVAQAVAITWNQCEQQADFLAKLEAVMRERTGYYAVNFPYCREYDELYKSFCEDLLRHRPSECSD